MAWKIETVKQKQVVDVDHFRKKLDDGSELEFERDVVYRWGYIIVREDPRTVIAKWAEDEIYVDVRQFWEAEVTHDFSDGTSGDNDGFEDLPSEEQELLNEVDEPEDAGWESGGPLGRTVFYFPLSVTEVADKHPFGPMGPAELFYDAGHG